MADQTELNNFIQSMKDMVGILDERFDDMKSLQSEEDPFYVSETIASFFQEADHFILEITSTLVHDNKINYIQVDYAAHELRECSYRIGGGLVAQQSNELLEASKAKNKERCTAAFDKIKEEYSILKQTLTHISKLEKKKHMK